MNLVMLPIGLNVLRNDGITALAIANCVGAKFIRVNVYTGGMVTDQGIIEGQARELQRYRRELGKDVAIFADVLVKHASPLGFDVDLVTAVQDTVERGLADGVIVSGGATGLPPSLDDLKSAQQAVKSTPILIGSGANIDNIAELMRGADGVIVASSLKRHGNIRETIDPTRVSQFVEAVRL